MPEGALAPRRASTPKLSAAAHRRADGPRATSLRRASARAHNRAAAPLPKARVRPMIDFRHIRDRKIGQWAMAYLAGAWLLRQLLDLISDSFSLSQSVGRIAIILLSVGFLAVLVVAWYHGEKGAQRVTGIELLMLAGILVIAGVAGGFFGRSGGGGEAGRDPTARAPVVEQGSIAVLPFVNMSGDAGQDYFSDGLTEEILNVLAQLPQLRVASRTSAFAFKGKDVGIDSIGRALRVAHVLEGSVRKSAERIRVTAQLIDADNGFHLWSGNYDSDLRDIFAVQDSISRSIVEVLKLKLAEHDPDAPLAPEQTRDPEAHRLLLQGLAVSRPGTRGALADGAALLRQAIGRDSSFARAHAELAAILVIQSYLRQIPRGPGYEEARTEARRALALDPSSPEANSALAKIADWRDWDWPTAEQYYARALEANPNRARTLSDRAWLLMRLGRKEEAIRLSARAVELDPLSTAMISNLGSMYVYAGQLEQALRTYRDGMALETTDRSIFLPNLTLVLADLGRHNEAVQTGTRAVQTDPEDWFAKACLGYAHARAGARAQAEVILRQLEQRDDTSPYVLAVLNSVLGRKDRAFALLEQAVAARDDFAADVAVEPTLSDLRGDPRLDQLLQKAGLPH
ncbi:MAG: hypothetical protein FIB01_16570 [Gemmatimonadetes bacterium]|nr:hypothetical protein [Gemmatimonadota bacterium]